MVKDLAQVMVDYQLKVETTHRKFYSDYHNLVLFHIKNKELIENSNNIIASSHLVLSTFKTHFGKIKISILEESGFNRNTAYKEAVEKSDKVISDYYNDQRSNLELFSKDFTNLLRSMSTFFSEFGLKFNYEKLNK